MYVETGVVLIICRKIFLPEKAPDAAQLKCKYTVLSRSRMLHLKNALQKKLTVK